MLNIVVSLGLLLGGATILAVVLRVLKQSNIIAFIGVGMLAGIFREQFELPGEVLDAFTEIGIILLLFMAGLEVDIKSLLKRWRIVLINGLDCLSTVSPFLISCGRSGAVRVPGRRTICIA